MDFQGVNAHSWRTFRFTKASELGSYDVMLMKLKNVTLYRYRLTDSITDHGLLALELLSQLKTTIKTSDW